MTAFRERFPSFPSVAANGAALSARTHDAVADDADGAHVEGIVERVNSYGFQADPVKLGTDRYPRIAHLPSVARQPTGGLTQWPS